MLKIPLLFILLNTGPTKEIGYSLTPLTFALYTQKGLTLLRTIVAVF